MMGLHIALRIVALATFFVGLGMFAGTIEGSLWRWLHLLGGLATVILAGVTLGPRAGAAIASALRGPLRWAWWWPVLPFAIGLTIFLRLWTDQLFMPALLLHILLGIAAIGLIEAALGRARRAAQPDE